jgi:cobalt/nickel transport system permease protein
MKRGFVEKTLRGLIDAAEYNAASERISAGRGLLQGMDARVKLVSMLAGVAAAVAAPRLIWIGALFGLAVGLAVASRIDLPGLARWIWIPVILFSGAVALPAVFLVPHGVRGAAFLVLRAETAATFSALLVFTTPWPKILRALRMFRCPVVVVAILEMTRRYIFLILRSAFEMLESRRSRTVGRLEPAGRRRMAASSAGVLLSRSFDLGEEVHLAMQARGFRGEIRLLEDPDPPSGDPRWRA